MKTVLDSARNGGNGQARFLHVVFYSHPWGIYALRGRRFGDPEQTLLVELSASSRLAAVFDRQNRPRFGLPGLLADEGRVSLVGDKFKGLDYPLALSPNPASSSSVMISAASLLSSIESPYARYVLMVPVDEAPAYKRLYPMVDRFTVLWDVADPATEELPQIAKSIDAAGCWSADTWGGFLWYSHPSRRTKNMKERLQVIREAIGAPQSALAAD